MRKIIDAVMLKLNETGKVNSETMTVVRYALAEVLSHYKVTETNEIATTDVLRPPGYQEFFANRIMEGLSDSTINIYKYAIDKFLLAVYKPVDKITGDDIAMYLYSKRKRDGVSASYVNTLRMYIGSYFKWAYEHEYIKKNPMISVKPIKEPTRKQDALTVEQFETLIKNAGSQRNRAMIAVMAGSGLRRSEVCAMRLKDLNIDSGKFTVIGKGDKERTCFLTSRAKMELKDYLSERADDCPYVFVTERFPHAQMKPTTVNKAIREAGERAGLNVHPHMLRHYFADSAHQADIDILDIARMMGHASVTTTQIYINDNTEDLAYKHHRIR